MKYVVLLWMLQTVHPTSLGNNKLESLYLNCRLHNTVPLLKGPDDRMVTGWQGKIRCSLLWQKKNARAAHNTTVDGALVLSFQGCHSKQSEHSPLLSLDRRKHPLTRTRQKQSPLPSWQAKISTLLVPPARSHVLPWQATVNSFSILFSMRSANVVLPFDDG